MPKTYNGHKNRNAWNVSLWLFNDEGFYRAMKEIVGQCRTKDAAARALLAFLPTKTPDGVPFTFTNVRLALRHWEA